MPAGRLTPAKPWNGQSSSAAGIFTSQQYLAAKSGKLRVTTIGNGRRSGIRAGLVERVEHPGHQVVPAGEQRYLERIAAGIAGSGTDKDVIGENLYNRTGRT